MGKRYHSQENKTGMKPSDHPVPELTKYYIFPQEAYGGHGFCHILKNIVPKMLHRGISNEVVDKILISNPSNWLSFSK